MEYESCVYIPKRAVTPRQLYRILRCDTCLGGAMIQSAGPSYFIHQKKSLPEVVSPYKYTAKFLYHRDHSDTEKEKNKQVASVGTKRTG